MTTITVPITYFSTAIEWHKKTFYANQGLWKAARVTTPYRNYNGGISGNDQMKN